MQSKVHSGKEVPGRCRGAAGLLQTVAVLVSSAGILVAGQAPAWKVEPAAPRGVFVEGDPVAFAVRLEAPPAEVAAMLRVLDEAGARTGEAAVSAAAAPGELSVRVTVDGPGYYRLALGETPDAPAIPFAVVPRHAAELRTTTGAIASDAAISWLVAGGPERREAVADCVRLARLCGLRMLRDRIAWGEVEPAPGTFRWGRYDDVAAATAAEGISVYQIFHDTPVWAREDRARKRVPEDLRVVYRFARASAERFRGRVAAWEPWNEPDIDVFSADPADQLAALQKAAWLGYKSIDPSTMVLMVSLALPPGPFIEGFLENETGPYFEVYNWHIYDSIENYPKRAAMHRSTLERFGLGGVPMWVTEAGIALKTPTGDLTHEQAVAQAEFLPKAYVRSLSSGVSRHFFFILPHFIERGVQFGLLDREVRPGPGYVALAALAGALGEATAPRRLGGLPEGAVGWVFQRGDGQEAAAVWTEGDRTVGLDASGLRGLDMWGRSLKPDGAGRIEAGPRASYLVGPPEAFARWSPDAAIPAPPAAEAAAGAAAPGLPGVVLRFLFPPDRSSKKDEGWRVAEDGVLRGRVQVYDLSGEPFRGEVALSLDPGLEAEPARWPVAIEPGEMALREVVVRWVAGGAGMRKLKAVARAAGPDGTPRASSAAVIRVLER